MAANEQKKDYGKLVKVLQIVTGIFMLVMVAVGIYLIKKYDINAKNIPGLAEKLEGGALTVGLIIIGISVVKSFCLVFPPAVILSVCAYVLPLPIALIVNLLSIVLSLPLPYLLGRFTGAGMVDTLKTRFKAVKKIDDFAGANEMKTAAVIKFSGILPGDLSSLLFGAMGFSFKNHMFGSTIGNLPLILVYSFFGWVLREYAEKYPWVVSIPIVVIILFLLIASLITKKMIADNKKANEQA